MSEYSIAKVLVERDGCEQADAEYCVMEYRAMIQSGESTVDAVLDELGLEPDYMWCLL